ncbi:porin family protein [Myroides sp. LJL116]
MNKYILWLTLSFTLALSAQNQDNVSFGVKAGWLQSTLVGKDKEVFASKGKIEASNNFFAGLQVDNPINRHIGFKHEVFYQNYGASFDVEHQTYGTIKSKLQMHSIRINPISFSVKSTGFDLYVGPYINVLLNSSITGVDQNGNTYKDYSIYGDSSNDQSKGDYLQKMDYGLVCGLSYNFGFGLSLGAQYTRGFASLLDNSNAYENDNCAKSSVYNSSFGVFVSYNL